MSDGHDHDLMVELNIKMNQLCKATKTYYEEHNAVHMKMIEKIDKNQELAGNWVKEVHDRIDGQVQSSVNRLDSCHRTFLQSKTFYWILAFVIVGLVSLAGYASYNRAEIQKDKMFHYSIENKQTKIEENN